MNTKPNPVCASRIYRKTHQSRLDFFFEEQHFVPTFQVQFHVESAVRVVGADTASERSFPRRFQQHQMFVFHYSEAFIVITGRCRRVQVRSVQCWWVISRCCSSRIGNRSVY